MGKEGTRWRPNSVRMTPGWRLYTVTPVSDEKVPSKQILVATYEIPDCNHWEDNNAHTTTIIPNVLENTEFCFITFYKDIENKYSLTISNFILHWSNIYMHFGKEMLSLSCLTEDLSCSELDFHAFALSEICSSALFVKKCKDFHENNNNILWVEEYISKTCIYLPALKIPLRICNLANNAIPYHQRYRFLNWALI